MRSDNQDRHARNRDQELPRRKGQSIESAVGSEKEKGPVYPGLTTFAGPLMCDPFFYASYYPRFVQLQLATGDMVQKALPEGALQPGGRMTGFLYFDNVDIGDVNGDDDMAGS